MRTLTEEFKQFLEGVKQELSQASGPVLQNIVNRKSDLVRHKVEQQLRKTSSQIIRMLPNEDQDRIREGKLEEVTPQSLEAYEVSQKMLKFPASLTFSVVGTLIRISTSQVELGKTLHYGSGIVPTLNLFMLIDRWWQEEAKKEGIDVKVVSSPELKVSL